MIAHQPRPFEYDLRVKQLVHVSSPGFPSGHTQGALTVWGYLFRAFKTVWFRLAAFFLIIFIPLSRLYLGVHFPFDLAGGYLLGIAGLTIFYASKQKIVHWFTSKGTLYQLAVVLFIPAFLVLISGSSPLVVSMGSALAGMGTGFILERRWIGFETPGSPSKRILRFVSGSTVLFIIWGGMKVGFSGLEPQLIFRFIRYFFLGCWGSLGAPWLFVTLGLADIGPSK